MRFTKRIRIGISLVSILLLISIFLSYHFNIDMVNYLTPIIQNNLSLNTSIPLGGDPTPHHPNNSNLPPLPELACKLPQQLIDDPLVKPYVKEYGPLNCSNETNWVYTANGRFYIDPDAVQRHGNITCNYRRIDRKDDYLFQETFFDLYANGSPLNGDQFYAECQAKDGKGYNNLHIGVPHPPDHLVKRLLKTGKSSKEAIDMNVLVYLMDSVSRINFIRKLPKLYDLLTKKMGALVMEGFNVVGDGTTWALTPMLTGYFPTELPEARKRKKNSSYVDDWPFVFKNFSSRGYLTSYAEEQPLLGAFYYRLKGFDKQPVDHYLRSILIALEENYKHMHEPYCLGDTPRSLIWLKFWRELQDMYRPLGIKQFSILFSSETSHEDYNYVQTMDDHWTKQFDTAYDEGYFNDTILLVMGDHGRRFGEVRQTQSGKLEEKLPFLSIILPQSFRERYPPSYSNLLKNQRRLLTVFDLHRTLLNILDFEDTGGLGDLSDRGISLFQEIPSERTCGHAHIKAHFCSCLDWKEEKNLSDWLVLRGAEKVIDYFNQQIAEVPDRCEKLNLTKIISARILKPNKKLMSFKETSDKDDRPNFSANTDLHSVLYQIRFITEPGGGDWEATVTYYLKMDTFGMSPDDISRLNAYNDQAQCVMNTHQHLRMFCYCRK